MDIHTQIQLRNLVHISLLVETKITNCDDIFNYIILHKYYLE